MDKQHVADAWTNFQRGKKPDESVVSDLVMRTWLRCREYNISPETPVYRTVPQPQLYRVKQKAAGLIASVHNAVTSIINPGYGDLFNVVLVTSDGITVYKHSAISQQSVTPTNEGMAFRLDDPGASAVSTCILERTPVIFSGAEHYCRAFHGMHCHALPLFDHHQNFVAVLSLSTSVQNKFRIPPFLPSLIANFIESQNNILSLKQECDAALSLTNDAVIVLNQDYAVQFLNHHAQKIFGRESEDCYSSKEPSSQVLNHIKGMIEAEGDFYKRPLELDSRHNHGRPTTALLSHKETEDGRHVLNLTWHQSAKVSPKEDSLLGEYRFKDIIGSSSALKSVLNVARKAAPSNASVLICGETGTGKELLASAIHNASPRSGKPFIAVNCGALPKELILSTLFGYSPGAFTGASRTGQVGKLELADGGTLFLDEIGELPLDIQAVLLRFLQDRIVTRVGSNLSKKVDVRIISATNRDLQKSINAGAFRADLFYRLNTIMMTLPALRNRKNDILLLVEHFMLQAENPLGIDMASFTEEAKEYLLGLPWKGNIRELQNFITRILIHAESKEITVDFLREHVCQMPQEDLREADESEKGKIISILTKVNGNMRTAAEHLQCSRSTLYYKLHKYGILIKDFRK